MGSNSDNKRYGTTLMCGDNVGQVSISTDRGMTWTPSGDHLNVTSHNDIEYNSVTKSFWTVYAASTMYQPHPLYSTNYGTTWTVPNTWVTSGMFAIRFATPLIGYTAGSSGKVFKTTDGGVNWFDTNVPVVTTSSFLNLIIVNENILWAIGGSGLCAKTTNGGTTWTPQNLGVTSTLYSGVALDQDNVYISGGTTSLGFVYKTTDGGATWNSIFLQVLN